MMLVLSISRDSFVFYCSLILNKICNANFLDGRMPRVGVSSHQLNFLYVN